MKFSCVTYSYNPNREWLDRAINSNEGLFDEYILVDDGSQIPITGLRSDIKVVRHETNKGTFAAKNTGVENATGDIICFLDDDDYFDGQGVLALKEFVKQNPDGDVYHFYLRKFGNETGFYGENSDPKDLTDHNSIPAHSWFKKKMWEEVGGFKYKYCEDWEFWLRCYLNKRKFVYFPHVVMNYNCRSDSVSANYKYKISYEDMKKEVLLMNGIQ
jgi:hypothetical protein